MTNDLHVESLILESPAEVARHAGEWNDLWERSPTTWPSARAEQICLWHSKFGKRLRLRVVVVKRGEKWLLCLPLVGKRSFLSFTADLPQSSWTSFGGDLLVDETACTDEHWSLLIAGVRKLRWPVLKLNQVRTTSRHWRKFHSLMGSGGWDVEVLPMVTHGLTSTAGDWGRYEASRREKKSRDKARRRLEATGTVTFECVEPTCPDEARRLTALVFEVEDRSWKGEKGTSVIAAGLLEHYQEKAVALAANRQLQVAFLKLDGQPVAAMFATLGKRVCHTVKVGYDEACRRGSPGQLLFQDHLKHMFAHGDCDFVDDMGPVEPYTAIWNSESYTVGQFVALQKWHPMWLALTGYDRLKSTLKMLRDLVKPTVTAGEESSPNGVPAGSSRSMRPMSSH